MNPGSERSSFQFKGQMLSSLVPVIDGGIRTRSNNNLRRRIEHLMQ
jgi:hypothetical protein